MLKKILSLCMSIMLVLSLAACNGGISKKDMEQYMMEIPNYYQDAEPDHDQKEAGLILYNDGVWEEVGYFRQVLSSGKWSIKKIDDEYVIIERSDDRMNTTVMDKYSRFSGRLFRMGRVEMAKQFSQFKADSNTAGLTKK